jgi:hypothetical protein
VKAEDYFDQKKRLATLYSLKDAATGRIVPFVPRREQDMVFDCLRSGVRKIIILKARRLGMSTAIGIYSADMAIFGEGRQISIIDRTQSDASLKLNGIVKVAYESLDDDVKARIKVRRDNDSSWELGVDTQPSSAIFAGINSRGGTNQLLHLSELGVIQADDPKRCEEIITGAIPTAEHGVTVIETTWKGGRSGMLWNLVKEAQEIAPEHRTLNDWHLFFFPWWSDLTYSEDGNLAAIEPETLKYLSEKEAEIGMAFTTGQKCWYARRRKTLGLFIYREFPTTIDECFKAPIEGAIYSPELDKLRMAGGIKQFPVDRTALVHTFWDLGAPVNTVVLYAQIVSHEIRIVDCDMTWGDALLDLTPVERVAMIKAKGYLLGNHYLPHDGAATQKSGRTFQADLESAGLPNTRIIPQTVDKWIGINRLRQLLPRFVFRQPACENLLEALMCYHMQRVTGGGLAKDEPVHDASSHAADACRMIAEAEMAGMLEGGSQIAIQSRRGGAGVKVKMGLSHEVNRRVVVRR